MKESFHNFVNITASEIALKAMPTFRKVLGAERSNCTLNLHHRGGMIPGAMRSGPHVGMNHFC